jgi:chromosome segregation ATPase
MSEEQNDAVNRPSHYIAGPYECATVARAVFGDVAWAVHCRITAWTYLWRAGKKGPSQEDVAKAARYLAMAADIDDRRSEWPRDEFTQMELDLAKAKRNEETLKAEIARLKQQSNELANRLLESENKAWRLEATVSVRDQQIERQVQTIRQIEAESKRNEQQTLNGEIARLRQQSLELAHGSTEAQREVERLRQQLLELAQGRTEAQKEVARLDAIREQNALVIAEQRKEAIYKAVCSDEIIEEKDKVIAGLQSRVDELVKAAKKRASK